MDARIPQYLTVAEVARTLRVQPITVRRWIGWGRLEAVKAGRKWLIPRPAFQAFQDSGRKEMAGASCALSGSVSQC